MAWTEWSAVQWARTRSSKGFAVDVAWQYRQDLGSITTEIRTTSVRLVNLSVYGFEGVTISLGAGVGEMSLERDVVTQYGVTIPNRSGYITEWPMDERSKTIVHNEDGTAPTTQVWGFFDTSAEDPYSALPATGWIAVNVGIPAFDLSPGEGSAEIERLDNGTATVRYTSSKACDVIQYRIGSGSWVTTTKSITDPGGSASVVINCGTGQVFTIYLRHKVAEISATSGEVSVSADFRTPSIQISKPAEEEVATAQILFKSSRDCRVIYRKNQTGSWFSAGTTTEGSLLFTVNHPEPEIAYVLEVYGIDILNGIKTSTVSIRVYPLVDQLRIREVYGGKIRTFRVWHNPGGGEIKKVKYAYKRSGNYMHKVSNDGQWRGAAITKQPESVTATTRSLVTFSVEATGRGLSYKWQASGHGKPFLDLTGTHDIENGAHTSAFTTAAGAGLDGYSYRCIVTDIYGNTATSETATLTITS